MDTGKSNRTRVKSSNVFAVGYDPESSVLEVEFKGGSVYRYSGVPQALYEKVMTSDSVGSFLSQNVKGIFPVKKVGPESAPATGDSMSVREK